MDALSLLAMANKVSADEAFSRGGIAPEMLQRIAQEQSDFLNSRAVAEERPTIGGIDNTDLGDMSFGKAFAASRSAGKKVFSWRGKSYNTKLAGETAPDFSGVASGALNQPPVPAVSHQRASDTYNDFSDVRGGAFNVIQRPEMGYIQMPEVVSEAANLYK